MFLSHWTSGNLLQQLQKMNTLTSSKSHKIIRIIHGGIYDSYSENWAGPVLTLVVSRQIKDSDLIYLSSSDSLEKLSFLGENGKTGRQVHLTQFPEIDTNQTSPQSCSPEAWSSWWSCGITESTLLNSLILWDRCWCLCCEATPLIQMPRSWGFSWSPRLFAPAVPIP